MSRQPDISDPNPRSFSCRLGKRGVWRIAAAAPPVFGDEPFVRIGGLRVLVEIAQPAVARRSIDVEIIFLDVLAVVAFVAGQAEGTLFEDRVAAVPQRERETQTLLLVAQSAQPVLVPAIGAGARLVVAKMVPGIAMGAVILADGAPGALRQIRAPQTPALGPGPLRL